MSANAIPQREGDLGRAWWREPEVVVLIVLVVAAYLVRVGDLSMRGEEPRWAQIAAEMRQRGDWIVPREQGETFLSRPPLQTWLIAASTFVCGSRQPWAVRLPSVLAMLFTALLVYGYARIGLSRVGALAAAIAFVTFGEMFSTGRQAETDMLFIGLVAASLLLWHWGQLRGWPATWTWIAGYVFVGLGVLCKGPQPPVYFLLSVSVYLVWTGQGRRLLSWAHLLGAAAGVAIVLAWMVPCALRTNWLDAKAILLNDTAMRFRDWKVLDVLRHLLEFPVEVLGSLLPWSLFLFGYASRDLRRGLDESRPQLLFAALCVVVAFPTCWIPPEGQTRYFAPLYPCLAVLIGGVVQGCLSAELPARARTGWQRFIVFLACVMVLAAAAEVVAAVCLKDHLRYGMWAEDLPVALAYAAAVVALAVLTFKARHAANPAQVRLVVLAAACFMVLTFTGILTNVRIRRGGGQADAVARLKEQLPPRQRLVSFGHIDALFAYYYDVPIDLFSPQTNGAALLKGEDLYFCFDSEGGWRPPLPCTWQEVGVISMDRNRHAVPDRAVVVGHLVSTKPISPGESYRTATVREQDSSAP